MNLVRNRFTAYAVALLIIVVDQISKAWVLLGLHLQFAERPVLPGIFDLTLVHNSGVSFGLFKPSPELERAVEEAGRIALQAHERAQAIPSPQALADAQVADQHLNMAIGRENWIWPYLTLFSVMVACGLAYWVWKAERPSTRMALGLVIGGALGNAVDRVAQPTHSVTDFLNFSGLHFPWVFNVADSAITIGVIVLLVEGLFTRETPAASRAEPGAPTPP